MKERLGEINPQIDHSVPMVLTLHCASESHGELFVNTYAQSLFPEILIQSV